MTGPLITEFHMTRGDDFYEALIDAHRELSEPESAALNARLILLLANHIGDFEILRAALEAARADAHPVAQDPTPSESSGEGA